ncbi:MAG: hydrolase [Actinomycetia bacterium]|nr:hydrolase [Actinomycetes bacterium]
MVTLIVPSFSSYDGTVLAYHLKGEGEPLVCLPGGPARPCGYLGDLGGLAAQRQLILLDSRGTGKSAVPVDPGTYRVDRLVADVEALRAHLGLETVDLLGHSAAGNLAILYAARHPDRVRRLVLVTPGLMAVGLEVTDEEWFAELERRSAEPWFDNALTALKAWEAGDDRDEVKLAARPFFYSPWNDAAQAHARSFPAVPAAADGFNGQDAPDPEATRAAIARLTAPVLVICGEYDPSPTAAQAAALAGLFPNARTVSVRGAHFPWVTAPREFASTVEEFLGRH